MTNVATQFAYMYVQDGLTALDIASWEGHGPVVELLLQTNLTDVNISEKVYVTQIRLLYHWIYSSIHFYVHVHVFELKH